MVLPVCFQDEHGAPLALVTTREFCRRSIQPARRVGVVICVPSKSSPITSANLRVGSTGFRNRRLSDLSRTPVLHCVSISKQVENRLHIYRVQVFER